MVANNDRFGGFKSSGKIGTIENLRFQIELTDLYQNNIPAGTIHQLLLQEKGALSIYLGQHFVRHTSGGDNFLALFSRDEVFTMGRDLVQVQHIVAQYDKCINNMKSIIAEIEKDYQ